MQAQLNDLKKKQTKKPHYAKVYHNTNYRTLTIDTERVKKNYIM